MPSDITHDPLRERDLAELGITAEVRHTDVTGRVTVTLPADALDRLTDQRRRREDW